MGYIFTVFFLLKGTKCNKVQIQIDACLSSAGAHLPLL